jgi:hypothetical protein
MSYIKLFSSLVTSTIWMEDDKTRIVWITMLAIADKNGEIQASIPGLARIAGVPVPDVEVAIKKFLAPDEHSRTPDDEGRRIEKIDGGWSLLNHAKYRAMASKDESKTSNAERQRRHRERQKRNGRVTLSNAPVTPNNATVTHDRDIAEAEAENKNMIEQGSLNSYSAEEFDLSDSQVLAREGKGLESLAARINLDPNEMLKFAKENMIPEKIVRTWASSRVVNGWKTKNKVAINADNWRLDLENFTTVAETFTKTNNGKNHSSHNRNDGTANAGRASAFGDLGKRLPEL